MDTQRLGKLYRQMNAIAQEIEDMEGVKREWPIPREPRLRPSVSAHRLAEVEAETLFPEFATQLLAMQASAEAAIQAENAACQCEAHRWARAAEGLGLFPGLARAVEMAAELERQATEAPPLNDDDWDDD